MRGFKKKPNELQETFAQFLVLVSESAVLLQQNRALIEEHGGNVDDLRLIIRKHGELGDAMRQAVARSRNRFPKLEEERS